MFKLIVLGPIGVHRYPKLIFELSLLSLPLEHYALNRGMIKKNMDIKYLINLGSNKLFVSAIILGRHQMFDDVNQAPKCILFGHKKKCNRHQSVKALKNK